jgi:ABC-type lipoprotein release transport system permease subunit
LNSPISGILPPIRLLEPSVVIACVGTAMLVGLLSSLAPAFGASRIPIVEALRSTD